MEPARSTLKFQDPDRRTPSIMEADRLLEDEHSKDSLSTSMIGQRVTSSDSFYS